MTLSQILDQGYQVGLINDLFVKDNILDKNLSILFDEGQFYPDTYFYIRETHTPLYFFSLKSNGTKSPRGFGQIEKQIYLLKI